MTFDESRRIFVSRTSGSSDEITVNRGKQQKKKKERKGKKHWKSNSSVWGEREKEEKKKKEKSKSGRDTLNTVQMNATRPRRMKRLTVHDN